MKKLPILFLVALALLCCRHEQEDGEKATASKIDDSLLLSDHLEAAYSGSIPPPANPEGEFPRNHHDKLAEYFNDSNYIQYAAAEQMGIEPVGDLSMAYHTRRPLVEIKTCDEYVVDRLTHSMPYLVPEAARLLSDIGSSFQEKARKVYAKDESRVIVTSMLRTPATVKRLRRVNRNAVDSSTHMFATTFDLSYNNFYVPEGKESLSADRLKMILAEVLSEKRAEGRCYIKYEKKSPCFHITVTK